MIWPPVYTQGETNRRGQKTEDIKAAQIAHYNVMRQMDGSKIKERRSKSSMLEKHNMLFLNQTAAEIKLNEAWKASRDQNYPISMKKRKSNRVGRPARNMRGHNRKEMR